MKFSKVDATRPTAFLPAEATVNEGPPKLVVPEFRGAFVGVSTSAQRSDGPAYGAGLLRTLKHKAGRAGQVSALLSALAISFSPVVSAHHSGAYQGDGYSEGSAGPAEPQYLHVDGDSWISGSTLLYLGGAGALGLYVCAGMFGAGYPRREQGEMPNGRVRDIMTKENPILYEVAAPVNGWDDSVRQLIADLQATQKEHLGLVGLAAPQIGDSRRVVVIGPGVALVNPTIVERFGLIPSLEECKSGGVMKPAAKMRNFQVTVRSLDPDGTWRTDTLRGLPAVVAQHECDHLDGKVIWKRREEVA